MKLIYLYDEFMRVPNGLEGRPIYIIDSDLLEGYQISKKVHEYRYFLAEESKAEIYAGKTIDILNQINKETPISTITTKSTFRPLICNLFNEIEKNYKIDFLKDYFLSTDNYLHQAKNFFQYWNKIKKNLKY
mgnify:CR=1 FL=1|tara:strand:- start:2578 stop:2973 length:396 start_codon:yes stop_codon:yes gene_type:complete